MGKVEGEGVFLAGGGTARAAEPALPLQGHDRDGGEKRLFLPTFLIKNQRFVKTGSGHHSRKAC